MSDTLPTKAQARVLEVAEGLWLPGSAVGIRSDVIDRCEAKGWLDGLFITKKGHAALVQWRKKQREEK